VSLTDADVALLQRMTAATGRPLVPRPASDEQWLQVVGRWSAEQDAPGKIPAAKTVYTDSVFGPVNLGIWFSTRVHEARGRRGTPTAQAAAQKLMPRIQDVLGLPDTDWWEEGDMMPKPKNVDEWLEVLERWHEAQETPGDRPKQTCAYADSVFGEVFLGRWLSTRVYEARGRRGTPIAQAAAQELMPRIQDVLGLPDADWWW